MGVTDSEQTQFSFGTVATSWDLGSLSGNSHEDHFGSAAITVQKHEKNKSVILKKHDKRGLLNLEYGVPEQVFSPPEPAPVFETSIPDIGAHLDHAIGPVAPPPPPLPPAIAHVAPAVPLPVPHPIAHPVPIAVPQPVAHPVPVAVPQPVPHPVPFVVPVTKHVAVPVPVDRAVPVPVDRPIPVPVAVPVPKPYPVHVEKIVHVDRPVPVPFDRPVHVPVDRPVAVPVPVPKPFPVPYEKVIHVDRPYPVHVAVPYHVPKPFPVPVAVHAHKSHGWLKYNRVQTLKSCKQWSVPVTSGKILHKEKKVIGMKAVRRRNAQYVESRNMKGAADVSTEKDVWHRHANIRIIEEMENEHLVIMKTTVGDIELELWAKETPKDKFHTRLRFSRRDLIVMANAGKDDNGSQFFFTLRSTPDVQNQHTIFGKFTGETICNMLKLEETLVDKESEEVKDSSKSKAAAVRHFNLLSLGEEAEEDKEESVILNKKFRDKGKLAHDHLTDPKLSSQPTVETPEHVNKKRKEDRSSD
ncbi:Peptidyl-prolyl cis-trans isomerase CWC27 like protein [Eufriesea mexicana]|nr:Peptidyl-prolyl cis-trans isomerase CWC27 like protein [Eufriesea mexicana]